MLWVRQSPVAVGCAGLGGPPVATAHCTKGKEARVRGKGELGNTPVLRTFFWSIGYFLIPFIFGGIFTQWWRILCTWTLDLISLGAVLWATLSPSDSCIPGTHHWHTINIRKIPPSATPTITRRRIKTKKNSFQFQQNFTFFRLVIILMEPRLVIMTLLKISEILTTLRSCLTRERPGLSSTTFTLNQQYEVTLSRMS